MALNFVRLRTGLVVDVDAMLDALHIYITPDQVTVLGTSRDRYPSFSTALHAYLAPLFSYSQTRG